MYAGTAFSNLFIQPPLLNISTLDSLEALDRVQTILLVARQASKNHHGFEFYQDVLVQTVMLVRLANPDESETSDEFHWREELLVVASSIGGLNSPHVIPAIETRRIATHHD